MNECAAMGSFAGAVRVEMQMNEAEWLELARAQCDCGLFDDSVESFRSALVIGGGDIWVRLELAGALFRAGEYADARLEARTVFTDTRDFGAAALVAQACHELGMHEECGLMAEWLFRRQPASPGANWLKGASLMHKDPVRAEALFKATLRIDPNYRNAALDLCEVMLKRRPHGYSDADAEQARDLAERFSAEPIVLSIVADLFCARGQMGEARRYLGLLKRCMAEEKMLDVPAVTNWIDRLEEAVGGADPAPNEPDRMP